MTSVVNMAAGQFVYWKSGSVAFANAGTVASASALTCGGRTWAVTPTISTTSIMVELPAVTATPTTGTVGAPNSVICGIGSVELFMKGWVDSQTYNASGLNAESTTCKCYSGRLNDRTDANALVNKYHADAAWSWPAPTNPSGGVLYLSISDVAFTPNTKGS